MLLKALKRPVERKNVVTVVPIDCRKVCYISDRIQRDPDLAPTALFTPTCSRVLDQDPPHGFCRGVQKDHASARMQPTVSSNPQKRLVHQCRGSERVPLPLAAHLQFGDCAEMSVHGGEENLPIWGTKRLAVGLSAHARTVRPWAESRSRGANSGSMPTPRIVRSRVATIRVSAAIQTPHGDWE